MEARIQWVGERTFVGVSGSGHGVVMGARYEDRPAPGPSPMEMLLLGLGACTAFDVVHILERGREPVTGCTVAVEAERAETDPQVFTRVHLSYVITGKGLARAKAERAVRLSEEKYCSASAMFIKTAVMTREVEVVDSAG